MPTSTGEETGTSPDTRAFYVRAFGALEKAGIPFLIGGAFALRHYTGIGRDTKDLDIFIRPADRERLLDVLSCSGCQTEVTFTHWLAKARCAGDFIDVIFSSGNAVCPVDDVWFAHAECSVVFDVPVRLSPVEEMIWSKAFIMERERYDGADVAHLLRARGRTLDWDRLVARFGPHWRVLLAHLVLFGFIYPGERDVIPSRVEDALGERLAAEAAAAPPRAPVCQGTLLSRLQYDVDVRAGGYADARLPPYGNMSVEEARRWTEAGAREAAEHVEVERWRG